MTHKYYDFYMRFPSLDDAANAQQFYNDTHKPKIGGKFVVNTNGVCSLSLRDECEVIMDLYQFGMKRFIIVDNHHGLYRSNGQEFFNFLTDTDQLHTFIYNEDTFEAINSFLKEDIFNDDYHHHEGQFPPIIKRINDEMGIDDLYDMLDVNAPGIDV